MRPSKRRRPEPKPKVWDGAYRPYAPITALCTGLDKEGPCTATVSPRYHFDSRECQTHRKGRI